jgi:hypothetical protein
MMGNIVAARRMQYLGQPSTIDSLITKAPGIAASAGTTAAIDSGAIVAGSALSIAIPIVGAVLGTVIGALFAAHAARVAGAKDENTILNSLITTVQQAVTAVFTALNNGSAQASDGISALQTIEGNYWQAVAQVEHGPGQAGNESQCVTVPGAGLHITGTASVQNPPGSNFSGYGPAHFDRSCTASCGVGCMWVASWVNVGIALIQAGGGQVTFDGVVGNKYGLQNYPALSISYNPPAPGSAAALSSGAGLLSTPLFGIPAWMIVAGLLAWKVLS